VWIDVALRNFGGVWDTTWCLEWDPAVEPLFRAWGIPARGRGPWWPLDDGQDSIHEDTWQQEVLANVALIRVLISSLSDGKKWTAD